MITLFLQDKIELARNLAASETAVGTAFKKLMLDKVIMTLSAKNYILNTNHTKVKLIAHIPMKFPKFKGKTIMDYLIGKFIIRDNRMYEIAPRKVYPILKTFLEEFPGNEHTLLQGIKFYYEQMVESYTKEGKQVFKYTKTLKNLLSDKHLINSLLTNNVNSNYAEEI